MKFSIQSNGNQTGYEKDVTLKGFLMSVTSTAANNITATVLQNIYVTVQLYRPSLSNPTVVMQGDAFSLAKASNPGSVEGINNIRGAFTGLNLGFGTRVINLNDGDELRVTVKVSGAVAGQVTTICTQEAVGIEDVTPVVIVYNALTSPQNQSVSLGDYVEAISVVETNATSPRITNINLASKNWSCDYAEEEFAALMSDQFFAAAVPATSFYCLNVYNGPNLDNVRGSIGVDSEATSNGALVVFGGFVNSVTFAKAVDTASSVQRKAYDKAIGA